MFNDTQKKLFSTPIIFKDVDTPIIFDDVELLQEKKIYLLEKENSELKAEKKQLNDKMKEIRIASGKITGLSTGVLKDNK